MSRIHLHTSPLKSAYDVYMKNKIISERYANIKFHQLSVTNLEFPAELAACEQTRGLHVPTGKSSALLDIFDFCVSSISINSSLCVLLFPSL